MKHLYTLIILFLIGCGTTKPTPQPTPAPPTVVYDTIHIYDTTHVKTYETVVDSVSVLSIAGSVNVQDFLALGDGHSDDYLPIINACNYCIANPKICTQVRFPAGHNFIISKPILLQNNGQFFTIKITGDANNKSSSDPYLSKITYTGKSGYAIGIQLGRNIEIQNLSIIGQYTFPNSVTNANIGILKFSDWIDPTIADSRYNPYAGIVIDPIATVPGGGGSSDISITGCSIRQWMVGVCLTPNPYTANDEMVNIDNDDIESCRVAIAIGQDQSKTISISKLKVWASVHTVLDGVDYGNGIGGGSVFCDNWNIAGNVNQLFNLNTDRFPLSCKDIYGESIFRIGNVGRGAGSNFINCSLNFLSGPGLPEPDYLLSGDANFYGGSIRYYDGSTTHRMNFVNTRSKFRDMNLSNIPITVGLYGTPAPTPTFDNVTMYYGAYSDTLIKLPFIPSITVDRVKWTSSFAGSGNIGDYVLGANRGCYDQSVQNPGCPTIQIGRITNIQNGIVTLDCVGLNCYSGQAFDAFYIDRIK